jgi:hypothetical protein
MSQFQNQQYQEFHYKDMLVSILHHSNLQSQRLTVLCSLYFLVSLLAAMATPPPTAPQIIIETPPTPQTTLQLETQTPPPQSNPPPFPPHPPFPVEVVSAPQSPLHTQPLLAESLATAPLTFGVIQAYYRRFRRFLGMEVVRALIGFGVGVLAVCVFKFYFLVCYGTFQQSSHLKLNVSFFFQTYFWMKNKK